MDFSLLTCTVQTFKFQKWRLILFLCFRNDKFDVYILVKFKWKRKCSFYVTKCFAPKFELGKHKAKQIVRCVYVTRKDDWTMNWKVVENYNLPKKMLLRIGSYLRHLNTINLPWKFMAEKLFLSFLYFYSWVD